MKFDLGCFDIEPSVSNCTRYSIFMSIVNLISFSASFFLSSKCLPYFVFSFFLSLIHISLTFSFLLFSLYLFLCSYLLFLPPFLSYCLFFLLTSSFLLYLCFCILFCFYFHFFSLISFIFLVNSSTSLVFVWRAILVFLSSVNLQTFAPFLLKILAFSLDTPLHLFLRFNSNIPFPYLTVPFFFFYLLLLLHCFLGRSQFKTA